MKFDFSTLKETIAEEKETKKKTVQKVSIPILVKKEKTVKNEVKEQVDLKFDDSMIRLRFDETDLQIFNLLKQKYKKQGTNIVRYNQRNPFIEDFLRLGGLFLEKETFELLYNMNLLSKSKYAGQWKLK